MLLHNARCAQSSAAASAVHHILTHHLVVFVVCAVVLLSCRPPPHHAGSRKQKRRTFPARSFPSGFGYRLHRAAFHPGQSPTPAFAYHSNNLGPVPSSVYEIICLAPSARPFPFHNLRDCSPAVPRCPTTPAASRCRCPR